MRKLIGLTLVLVLGHLSMPAITAADETEGTASVSPLLVLLAADDDTAIRIERQLVGELRLALDGVQVEQIAIERADFLTVTLPEQLAVVQPLIRRFMARAAVWVVTGGRSGYLIQFVVSDRGNATVRTVNAGSPEELALAVRELLDSAYLFTAKKKPRSDPSERYLFAVGSTVTIGGGIVGHKHASVMGGPGLQARFKLNDSILLGLQVAGKLGPVEEVSDDGILVGWRTEFGVFAGYRFRIGNFFAGPYGEATAHRNIMNSVLEAGDWDRETWWSFRGALGIELGLGITEHLSLFSDWTVGGIATPVYFVRSSNRDATVLKTPLMDYAFTVGLSMNLL